jgi:hypothetical protein
VVAGYSSDVVSGASEILAESFIVIIPAPSYVRKRHGQPRQSQAVASVFRRHTITNTSRRIVYFAFGNTGEPAEQIHCQWWILLFNLRRRTVVSMRLMIPRHSLG